MHEVHFGEKSCVVSASGRPGSSGVSNNDMGHTQGEDPVGGSQSTSKRARRGKRNGRQQGVDVYPDQDKDYYGDVEDVNNLVKFINNDITAENLKKIDGNVKDGEESNLRRVAKKRERRVKSSGADGSCPSSDPLWREASTSKPTESSVNEEVEAKETEVKKPEDTDSIGMGNTSSSEKLDVNEEEAHPSSSEIIAAEPDSSQKIIKNKTQKPESGKKPKNRGPDKMTSPVTKPSKNNVEKVKPQLQDHLKDTDSEETKQKNSKKGRSKPAKTETPVLPVRASSPSLPALSDLPLEVTGSAEEQWEHCVPKKLQRKMRSQNQTFATVANGNTAVVSSQTRSKDKQISPSACSFDRRLQQTAHQPPSVRPLSHRPPSLDTVELERREKDLNPSDFPALKSSPRELRENMFDSGASVSDKDSDKESSTSSFPAEAGVGSRGNTRHFVSYATMASGNRSLQSAGPSKPESANFCVEDSSVEFSADQAPLEWARPSKERRHSIGSAPKEPTKSVFQRSGSQEMLSCDKNLCSPPPFSEKVDKTEDNKLVSSDSTGSFTSSDADSVRGSEIVAKGTGEECPLSATNTSVTSLSRTPVEIKNSGAHAVTPPSSSNVRAEGGKTKSSAKSIPVESALKSQTHRTTESKVSSSGAKQANNGCKKAVEFFDSRNEMCTPIAGLAFGSFRDHEYASILTHSALNKASVPINGEQPQGAVFSSSVSQSSQRPSAADPAPADSDVSSSDQTEKPKGPHIGGLNGLVSPQITNKNPTLVLQTPTQLNSTCSAPAPETTLQASEGHSTTIKQDNVPHGPALKQYTTVCVCPAEQVASKPTKEWIVSSDYSYGWITSVNFLSEGWVGKNSYREKMMNDGGSWMVQMNALKTTM